MDKIVRRITVVHADGSTREAAVVYKKDNDKRRGRRKTSPMLRPIERVVRFVAKAGAISSNDAYDRHIKSASKRRNGWVKDAPSNMHKAHRKFYNEARKGLPFRMMPRAN